ncbi:MAG: porin family protein [Bacteroidota bacterium]
MKRLGLLMLCMLAAQLSFAQFKFGVRAGMSTTDVSSSQLLIKNSSDLNEFGLSVKEANYGVHFGVFAQAQLGNFFIQPELLLNSTSVDYSLEDLTFQGNGSIIKNESFQNLDIPLMIGYKIGPLRLQGGPVAHVFLDSTSELFDIANYSQNFDDLTWGYQAGIGLDIWKLVIDFKYEGNFQKYGDHIVFFGNQYQFDDRPGRMIASLGFAF